MTTVRRSLAYSFADSYLSVIMQLAGTMIIARLLTPAETGVFAVAAVFAAFASTFRDFGVAEYMIQEHELTDDKIRSALAANIAVSWAMAIVLYGSSGLVAEFYKHPGIADVMHVQAFNFLLIPFGAVTMAYFRRELDFKPMFVASMLSNIATFVVATACALTGLGYMSLAWSSLAGVIVTVATSVAYRPKRFPRWPGIAEIGSVIRFGKHASGIYIFGQVGKSAPEIIVGRALDMPSVAFLSRANGLIEIFHKTVLRAILPVCLPYFAKSTREQGSVNVGYLRAVSYLTAIGWPFFACLGFLAYGAIRIVYGNQWTESVVLSQILCAAAIVEIVHYLAKEAIIAAGRVDRGNLLQIGVQTARITGLLAVIPFGLTGACWGLLVAAAFGLLLSQWALHRTIALTVGDIFKTCLPSAHVTMFSVAPVAAWTMFTGVGEANFLELSILGGTITAALWLLGIRIFVPSLWAELARLASRLPARSRQDS